LPACAVETERGEVKEKGEREEVKEKGQGNTKEG
jgi:hypothetical protein